MVTITQASPKQDEVLILLRHSDEFAAALYPPESCHMVDVDALTAASVRFFVARLDGRAVGCGALVLADAGQAEIKRMFVDPSARGHGVGRAILTAIEDAARNAGVALVQLETGTSNHDALGLYRRFGYREREPFGGYRPDPLSVFMEKSIRPSATVPA